MTHNKTQNISNTWYHMNIICANNLYECAMSKLPPTGGLKEIDLQEFSMNKYTRILQRVAFS